MARARRCAAPGSPRTHGCRSPGASPGSAPGPPGRRCGSLCARPPGSRDDRRRHRSSVRRCRSSTFPRLPCAQRDWPPAATCLGARDGQPGYAVPPGRRLPRSKRVVVHQPGECSNRDSKTSARRLGSAGSNYVRVKLIGEAAGFYGPGRPATPDVGRQAVAYARRVRSISIMQPARARSPAVSGRRTGSSGKSRSRARSRATCTSSDKPTRVICARPRYAWQGMGARYDHLACNETPRTRSPERR